MSDPTFAGNFIIPVGTQVVLRGARPLPGTERALPAGTVAEVIEPPASNDRPYVLRLLDGTTLRAKFGELAIRRQVTAGAELSTPGLDVRPLVVYRVLVGSRAFGLSTEASDADYRSVYVPPAELHWGLYPPPEQLEYQTTGIEEVTWEIEKYLKLALAANPNILETLWSPIVVDCTEIGHELRNLRMAFLSKYIYQTYSGYVLAQFRLLRKKYAAEGVYKPKHAMHLIRLLHSGIAALNTGEIRVDVAEQRAELLRIRAGEVPFDEVRERALALDQVFQAAYTTTTLPERPDYARVNTFLIATRRRMAALS
jgi:hypothetical protein